ncbi:photosystem I reaction center subunit PsaK [Leptolyngbya sp. FACHB-711]|uniref:photosystem I reaction center subunit PsaK n=1 Tax=unclassified Leptolyngbya TaxID=2650499 RepID=UPI001684448C|nr:photosystem I reaction center subunit PsaK [Leptolyngbya sp. FACHB-711]MBD1851815.1 photosystem I reaction center subunit PsaK [Cyanobacteria bacterium FACHB-502]MBD2026051.1 photosystem I reaction center subunit PsaK [Leptolyngbya sp. FACHB-711]
MFTALIADVVARLPEWTPTVGLIMLACNLVALAIGKVGIRYPKVGPGIPILSDTLGLSAAAILAATSFGHIIGTGVILGLTNAGVI